MGVPRFRLCEWRIIIEFKSRQNECEWHKMNIKGYCMHGIKIGRVCYCHSPQAGKKGLYCPYYWKPWKSKYDNYK